MAPQIPGDEVHTEVLIIGAGPTGLMAAIALSRYGVEYRIIDKKPCRTKAGHASGSLPLSRPSVQYAINTNSLRRLATSDSGDRQNFRSSRRTKHERKPHE